MQPDTSIPSPPDEETPFTLLIRQDWELWYPRYLDSPHWQELRYEVMERANWVCEACKVATASEVHHLTYGCVGNENLDDLQALCGACHRAAHKK